MLLKGEQLAAHLERELRPLYVVYGDEPLLVIEAADAIRARARQQGYSEREVLTGRFGLYHREPETLEALAERLGLTRERVRQIQQEALAKLKRHLQRRGIDRDSVF